MTLLILCLLQGAASVKELCHPLSTALELAFIFKYPAHSFRFMVSSERSERSRGALSRRLDYIKVSVWEENKCIIDITILDLAKTLDLKGRNAGDRSSSG